MAGHRAGIAEAEIEIAMAVRIGEMRPLPLHDENGEPSSPLGHPVHGYAFQQVALSTLEERV
jgi:hypothetical protein